MKPNPNPNPNPSANAAKNATTTACTDAATDDFADATSADEPIHEARLWRDNGWTARVIKNNDDDGWAVEMIRAGEPEPALTGPWTMGRDKKNPKPLDTNAFNTLVKTAHEVVRRHEQAQRALLHKETSVMTDDGRVQVTLDITPDEDDPYAMLAAFDADGAELARVRVGADYRFSSANIEAWITGGMRRPG